MKINWLLALMIAGGTVFGEGTGEIIELLKQHYVDHETLDAKKLDDASVAGILQMLGPAARVLTAAEAAQTPTRWVENRQEVLARVEIIQPDIGYIRVSDVREETALALDAELQKFAASKVSAYILDLRFADGTNYPAVASVASRLLPSRVDLFTLKQAKAEPKTYHTMEVGTTLAPNLAEAPLMLLVNAQTRGSAEVLVGALRAQDRGIVIGGPTAGLPVAWKDIPFADGRILRLASAKITLPKGLEPFPGGIIPDILVKIDPMTEQDVVFNVASNVTLTALLQPKIRKRAYTEASLVRAFRGEQIEPPSLTLTQRTLVGGTQLGTNGVASAEEEGDSAAVRDVVLQRAVDVLKGIRVFLSWQ